MITKYIGSIYEFLNCELIEFVMVAETSVLTITNISSYNIDNPIILKHRSGHKTRDGRWIAEFNKNDHGFILNNLIVYNKLGDPIGFVDLTQDIDIIKYAIESVEVIFDYRLINNVQEFDTKINYRSHLAMTKAKLTHHELFELNLGQDKATQLSELKSKSSNRQLFTRNLITARRDESLIYRYSGKLVMGNEQLYQTDIIVDKELIDDYSFHETITLDNVPYLISYSHKRSSGNLVVTNLLTGVDRKFNEFYHLTSKLNIGSNYIITGDGDNRMVIDTRSLVIDGIIKSINRVNLSVHSKSEGINSELRIPYISEDIRFAKDPINKLLLPYYISDNNIVPLSTYLSDIITQFELTNINLPILFASKGLLILGRVDELGTIVDTDINGIKYDTPRYYSYPLSGSQSKPIYSKDPKENEELTERLNRILIGANLNDIIFLSTRLIFVNKAVTSFEEYRNKQKSKFDKDYLTVEDDSNDPYVYYISYDEFRREIGSSKYLIAVDNEFDYSEDVYDYVYKLKIYNLQGISGLLNYDKIAKSYDYNLRNLDLISLASEGNLYGCIEFGTNTYKLVKL